MTKHASGFDEVLLSGYLDGELTQGEEQRVRLRLEEDAEARSLLGELEQIRAAARSTELPAPSDAQWDEAPRDAASRWMRRTGWTAVLLIVAVLAGLAGWAWWTAPESPGMKLLAAGIVAGPLLLLGSVWRDRVRVGRTDRYRRVKK